MLSLYCAALTTVPEPIPSFQDSSFLGPMLLHAAAAAIQLEGNIPEEGLYLDVNCI